jgi:alanine dehydrogenase
MKIGVPKEIKPQEYRVGLTPASVREYVAAGHKVIIERNAGGGIGASDDAYTQVGASIASSAEEVFAAAEMIVKVKEPQKAECALLRDGQILFTYLHLAPDPEQADALLKSGCIAVAYETVTDTSGGLPLLAPMSEVAGRLAIEAAGKALQRHEGGRGLLLGGVPGVPPARVVIIGGGVVGTHAARMAVGLGSDVSVFDRSLPRLRYLDDLFEGRVRTNYSTREALDRELVEADVVVGAVLVPGANAPKLVSEKMLQSMKRGSVLVDVAIDQGGCFETSRPTTHADPVFEVNGVVHYCVPNMPGVVPVTSSHALNNATLPFGLEIASGGTQAIARNKHIKAGLNVFRGRITHRSVAEALALPFTDPAELLAA